jgi:outer membrane protein OmpA-like peptidoglycan-associated protein
MGVTLKKKNFYSLILKFYKMKSILTTIVGIGFCLGSFSQTVSSSLSIASLSEKESGLMLKKLSAYNTDISVSGNKNKSTISYAKNVVVKKTFAKTTKKATGGVRTKEHKTDAFFEDYSPTIFDSGTKADSFFKYHNENSFLIKYSTLNKGEFKYKFHIEGRVKNCLENSRIAHAYVSINSAVVPDRYVIIPTNIDGYFSTDVDDDSIGSITIIKKGYADKEIALPKSLAINENTAYSFDVCMAKPEDKVKATVNLKSVSTPSRVYFDFNKATLTKETKKALDNVVENLKSIGNVNTILEINGYADKKGSKEYNLKLSKERSLACKSYIEKHGLKNVKIKVNAFGSITKESTTSGNNDGDTGIKDRRVDIIITANQ